MESGNPPRSYAHEYSRLEHSASHHDRSHSSNGTGPFSIPRKPIANVSSSDGPDAALMPSASPGKNPQEDSEPHTKRAHRTSEWFQWLFVDSWALEYLALFISVAALAAIAGILGVYNGLLLEEWSHSIQLNTVISTLATVMEGFMLVAVCACLSQLKWLWYKTQSRPLKDFQTFDQASRGPWGATQLLLRLRFWHMASLGSLITLLALALGPVVQQSVSYPLREVVAASKTVASIPYAQDFLDVGQYNEDYHTPTQSIKNAIYNGIYSLNLTKTGSTVSANCATGNCTYPPYVSLAVCSNCEDVTRLLKLSKGSTGNVEATNYYNLPNGLSTFVYLPQGLGSVVNMSASLPLNTNNLDKYQAQQQIGNLSIIVRDHLNYSIEIALDCVLSYCAKSYHGQVSNGKFDEHVTGICDIPKWYPLQLWDGIDPSYNPSTFEIPEGQLPAINDTRNFTIGWLAWYTLGDYFVSMFKNELYMYDDTGGINFDTSNSIGEGIFYNRPDELNATITNIADALTNTMRLMSDQRHQGTTHTVKSYIHVRWLWLLLPLTLLVLTLVFLTITIWQSHGIPYWRSSALAVMEHGVSTHTPPSSGAGPEKDALTAVVPSAAKGSVSKLETWAAETNVRLRRRGSRGDIHGLVAS